MKEEVIAAMRDIASIKKDIRTATQDADAAALISTHFDDAVAVATEAVMENQTRFGQLQRDGSELIRETNMIRVSTHEKTGMLAELHCTHADVMKELASTRADLATTMSALHRSFASTQVPNRDDDYTAVGMLLCILLAIYEFFILSLVVFKFLRYWFTCYRRI